MTETNYVVRWVSYAHDLPSPDITRVFMRGEYTWDEAYGLASRLNLAFPVEGECSAFEVRRCR
jgi:hypothetical protein